MELHQIDCFKINIRIWTYLGIWPCQDSTRYYDYYSKFFVTIFLIVYIVFFTVNFYFIPKELDLLIDDLIFYFTELSVLSKVMTFIFSRKKIVDLLAMLESDIFQPDDAEGLTILEKSKKFNRTYFKTIATVSGTSNIFHVIFPMILHLLLGIELLLPVCKCFFLSEDLRDKLLYPLYIYQSVGIHIHMQYNITIDSFFLGLMVLTIAQLDILDVKLRKVADRNENDEKNLISELPADQNQVAVKKLIQCIIHFDEVSKFCRLVEDVFSTTLFMQFSMASCIICICLFRFTLPAPFQYYIFLITYMLMMVVQIMVPCWFGTKIMDKSNNLSFATYSCDWTPRSRQFKSNLRVFVQRANKPLSITGGKMFCLSLSTFTSIINSAYSMFTLLQHMQSQK